VEVVDFIFHCGVFGIGLDVQYEPILGLEGTTVYIIGQVVSGW
jgi:hypothetical protein